MGKQIRSEEMDRLLEGILCLENKEEAYQFFEDLCTVNELVSLCQRFAVAGMLREEKTYLDNDKPLQKHLLIQTISRVNRALNYGNDGYDMVIRRLEQNEDATIGK